MMIMKQNQACVQNPTTLGMNKNSQKIGKPNVRIIHIYAPEIIKTDVANFRDLVQRLTGKPTVVDQISKNRKYSSRNVKEEHSRALKRECFRDGRVKEEEDEEDHEIWGASDNSGNFLGGFGDLDGFMQQLVGFPLEGSHMEAFGETHQLASY